MGRAFLLSLLTGAMPMLAVACPAPSLEQAVRSVLEAPEGTRLHLLAGQIDFDTTLLPPSTSEGEPDPPTVPARFAGTAFMPEALALLSIQDVTLRPLCDEAGCGTLAPMSSALLLAEQTPEGYVIELGPCGHAALSASDEELEAAMLCLFSNGASCEDF